MAPKISSSFVSILVLFLAIQPFAIHSRSLKSTTNPRLASFESLEGTLKGQTKQGIKEVKRHLRAFGYLDHEEDENHVALLDDKFDDALASALESYQKFYRLKVTGKLDADTVKRMSAPRCGVADLVRPRRAESSATNHSKLHFVARYNFFPGTPKWPPSQTHLNYTFGPIPAAIPLEEVRGVSSRAFRSWANVSSFTFSETPSGEPTHITIGFYSRDHGDGNPFDGPGKVLAHSFAPTDGRFHYDADEQWSTAPSSAQFDLESVAVHEIGHLLGLAHTPDENAVMYAFMKPGAGGVKRDLRQDDINGIRALYAGQ